MSDKDMQLHEKHEVQGGLESTRNVPVFIPAVDIYESENELTLLADMPGVAMDNIDIDLERDELTIRGSVKMESEPGQAILHEYTVGDYYRQFSLSGAIDRDKIEASVKDGVLKLVLPKADVLKPRKISVKAS